MQKDFDTWSIRKKETHNSSQQVVFYEREVWWLKCGINIGAEIDGRHELFLRPAIVIRKFNKDMAVVIPTTTQEKQSKYYFDVFASSEKKYKACLSQIRTISTKRLVRKIDTVREDAYRLLLGKVCEMIQNGL